MAITSGNPVTTGSGIPLKPWYGAEDLPPWAASEAPGQPPYTRGIHPGGYRDRLWTFRQYSGFGTAEESNQRYRVLLDKGGTGLSVALDLPTQCGYDSDHPDAEEEVGRVGVAIDSLRDMEILFDGIPLDRISTSFTINGTAAILLAMYIVVGERQGVEPSRLRGTIQNDILKEYVARGTWIWPPTPSLRLIADTIEFCAAKAPRFNAISVAGAHFRDAGATAVQEMAFTLQDAVTYVDTVLARGRASIDDIAPVISFFFYTHSDFFEEVCKYRAGRRLWASLVTERYGARRPASAMFRAGCVCGGSTLHARQAQINTVRVAYQAMAAVLGGVQSMFTAAWDEPFALPTEESTTLALRTQQVLAHETGVAAVVDPLGGSYYVEALTAEMESRMRDVMADLEARGGMVACIENGYVQRLIADEAYRAQLRLESGEQVVVGVNRFQDGSQMPDVGGYEMDPAGRRRQLQRLAAVRRERDPAEVNRCLRRLEREAAGDANLMPALIDCVRAYCTLGELSDILRGVWGEFQQPVAF